MPAPSERPPSPRRTAVAVATAVLLLLTACGGDEPGDEPGGASGGDGVPLVDDRPRYVALGDSYTAAPGISETVDAGCARSDRNYPALVAEQLDLELTDVSCGGAATTSLIGVQQTSDGPRPPQFDALTDDTDVVTLGIGGNDESLFGQLIATCLQLGAQQPSGSPCRDRLTADGTDQALETIEVVEGRVTSALRGIKDRVPDAEVVLVGYPQLVPERGRCDELPLAAGDYAYARGLLVALGEATERAAAAADVEYVDLLGPSRGHDVCAGDEAWVSGVTADPDRPAAPMHPYAEEQVAVAELVVEALED